MEATLFPLDHRKPGLELVEEYVRVAPGTQAPGLTVDTGAAVAAVELTPLVIEAKEDMLETGVEDVDTLLLVGAAMLVELGVVVAAD